MSEIGGVFANRMFIVNNTRSLRSLDCWQRYAMDFRVTVNDRRYCSYDVTLNVTIRCVASTSAPVDFYVRYCLDIDSSFTMPATQLTVRLVDRALAVAAILDFHNFKFSTVDSFERVELRSRDKFGRNRSNAAKI